MAITKGKIAFGVNVFFYETLKIQQRRLKQDLKIYFDEKDITLDVKTDTTDYTSIGLYFFKDKRIKEMQEYIVKSLKEREKCNDIDYCTYNRHEADVRRDIDFEATHMWNGKPITNEINLRLLTLKHIQSSSYYNRVKPNYDKHIDKKLSDNIFEDNIKNFVAQNLSYPFNMSFNSIEEEREFIYVHDTEWHANFLYEQRVDVEKYNLCYSLFDKIYKKNKDYYIVSYECYEKNNILNITFIIKDKLGNEYSLSHFFERCEKVVDKKYSGENFSYHLPDYKIKDICKTLINPVEDKKYKKLIEKFESLF